MIKLTSPAGKAVPFHLVGIILVLFWGGLNLSFGAKPLLWGLEASLLAPPLDIPGGQPSVNPAITLLIGEERQGWKGDLSFHFWNYSIKAPSGENLKGLQFLHFGLGRYYGFVYHRIPLEISTGLGWGLMRFKTDSQKTTVGAFVFQVAILRKGISHWRGRWDWGASFTGFPIPDQPWSADLWGIKVVYYWRSSSQRGESVAWSGVNVVK